MKNVFRINYLFLILMLCQLLLGCGAAQKAEGYPMTLPLANFYTLKGTIHDFGTDKRSKLLIFFNSTCDTCKEKARFYQKFSGNEEIFQVYLISNEDLPAIERFVFEFNLGHLNGVTVLQDKDGISYTDYFVRSNPTILLYNKDNSFDQSFSSEAPVGYIIDEIKRSF
jgi:thiol-disulfide isomerase/thioredoxin|uniref:TlpA family protein disulfide reductase n=1 Tax=Roseivirga sp. TaxID=1964215 RepID=UPI004047F954